MGADETLLSHVATWFLINYYNNCYNFCLLYSLVLWSLCQSHFSFVQFFCAGINKLNLP